MLANTRMRSPTKRDLICRIAVHVKAVRIWEFALISICCAIEQDRPRACWKRNPVHVVIACQEAGETLDRRLQTKDFIDGTGARMTAIRGLFATPPDVWRKATPRC